MYEFGEAQQKNKGSTVKIHQTDTTDPAIPGIERCTLNSVLGLTTLLTNDFNVRRDVVPLILFTLAVLLMMYDC